MGRSDTIFALTLSDSTLTLELPARQSRTGNDDANNCIFTFSGLCQNNFRSTRSKCRIKEVNRLYGILHVSLLIMASSTPVCSLCELRSITQPSVTWCIKCEKELCSECQEHHSSSKKTRNHKTVPVTDYQQLPINIPKISENCDKHNEKFTVYCKNHQCPCCSICIIEDHCERGDLVKLADVTKNIKSSVAFLDIEDSFAILADNIKTVQLDRENNLRRIDKMKRKIEKEIKQTRISINNHLDKIQTDIMNQLDTADEKENKHIDTLLILLKDKENEINEFQKNIVNIKQYATNLQTFLHMKQLEDEVSVRENFLELMIDKKQFQDRDLIYHATSAIQKFVKDIHSFGTVTIQTKPSHIDLKTKKNKQVHVPHSLSKSVNNIKLKLKLIVHSTGNKTLGCCILPDGRMAFPDYYNRTVRVFDNDGKTSFDVKTYSYACDIAYISENDKLAVTSGKAPPLQYISLLGIKHEQNIIREKILVSNSYYGIAVKGTKMFCSAVNKGIQSIKKSGKSQIIVLENESYGGYVAIFGDKIYHTNHQTHYVTCYDLKGETQWTFKNVCVLEEPRGISVDNDGNVFVVGNKSKNVVVLSADGKQHKEILKASDDLLFPYTLDCNRSTNELLVANDAGKAMLFTESTTTPSYKAPQSCIEKHHNPVSESTTNPSCKAPLSRPGNHPKSGPGKPHNSVLESTTAPSYKAPQSCPGKHHYPFLESTTIPSWESPNSRPGKHQNPVLESPTIPSLKAPQSRPGKHHSPVLESTIIQSGKHHNPVLQSTKIPSWKASKSCSWKAPQSRPGNHHNLVLEST
ncbi:unnamed protein product [Mytilus coruscus]|uniref:B box-type domain-containing protein n=1 Tax=Mytilus coruscus TaxID=42192 RepID=A0A6J8EA98_MYTCO|nr:unnamed protein product [Mytilus coruscus]